jgi:metal-responsive CopG/Arc/MetJ family transcriptional regulator
LEYRDKNLTWALCEIDSSKLSENIKRINITIPERLLTKIDSCAQNEGETRSGFLTHAALEYIAKHAYQ